VYSKAIWRRFSGERYNAVANKQNVFDDFIAASQWLIDNKYTKRRSRAIFGGSHIGFAGRGGPDAAPGPQSGGGLWHSPLDVLQYDPVHGWQILGYQQYGAASDS